MLSLGDRIRVYPDFIIRRLCGANVVRTVVQRLHSLISGGRQFDLADDDYEAVERLADRVQREFLSDSGISAPFSIEDLLRIRAYAERCVAESLTRDVTKVLFITDDSLASLRRYVVPARAMSHVSSGSVLADCSTELNIHHALSYDIIVVKEIAPQDYVVLRRLQYAGKIIVFDLDENLFDIPSAHPKAMTFTPLTRELHRSLLQTADFISVRRMAMAEGLGCIDRAIILPDMVEMAWILPSPSERSPDRFNIVCFADDTRQEDVDILGDVVEDCIRGLPSAHVTFVGCVPTGYMEILNAPVKISATTVVNGKEVGDSTLFGMPRPPSESHEAMFLPGRIHNIPFPPVKDYYNFLSQLPVDLALVPRTTNGYNAWGSEVEILELLAKGVPVLASKVGKSALFESGLVYEVKSIEDWEQGIKWFYESTEYNANQQSHWLAEMRARHDSSIVAVQWVAVFQSLASLMGRRGIA